MRGHVVSRCDERIVFGTEESLSYSMCQSSVNSTSAKHCADSITSRVSHAQLTLLSDYNVAHEHYDQRCLSVCLSVCVLLSSPHQTGNGSYSWTRT